MIALLLMLRVAGAAELVDRIAAVVDDQPLALSEVYDLGGTFVSERCPGGAPTDPAHVKLGMPVKLTTFVAGTDDDGTEAIAFAFEPQN